MSELYKVFLKASYGKLSLTLKIMNNKIFCASIILILSILGFSKPAKAEMFNVMDALATQAEQKIQEKVKESLNPKPEKVCVQLPETQVWDNWKRLTPEQRGILSAGLDKNGDGIFYFCTEKPKAK